MKFAEPFAPDLVLVNYIPDDFNRVNYFSQDLIRESEQDMLTFAPDQSFLRPETIAVDGPTRWESLWPLVNIRGEQVQLPLTNLLAEGVKDYDDPLTFPGAIIGACLLVKDPEAIDTPEKLKAIKSEIARRYLRSRIWRSWRSFAVLQATRQPISFNGEGGTLPRPFSDDDKVTHAVQAMDAIVKRAAAALFLRNPLHPGLHRVSAGQPLPTTRLTVNNSEFKYTDMVRERRPGYRLVDMQEYLPDADLKESYTWYNLPHDGHWSNKGVDVYAEALHRMLQERLRDATPATEKQPF